MKTSSMELSTEPEKLLNEAFELVRVFWLRGEVPEKLLPVLVLVIVVDDLIRRLERVFRIILLAHWVGCLLFICSFSIGN